MTDDLIARLRGPRTEQGGLWPIPNLHDEAADAIEAAATRIAELKSALKPFSYTAVRIPDTADDKFLVHTTFELSDLRAARAAYLGEREPAP